MSSGNKSDYPADHMMKPTIEMFGMERINNKLLLIILVVVCWLPATAYGQAIFSRAKKISADTPVTHDTVYAENLMGRGYVVRVYNPQKKSVYLFCSYLYDNLFMSEYLHLYSKKKGICTLSLLPLPYFMSFTRSDNLILGKNAVVNKNQIIYQFAEIPPASYMDINFPQTCFDADYVKSYEAKSMSLNNRPAFKKYKSPPKCTRKEIRFAVYSNIDALNKNVYHTDLSIFSKEILNYKVLSVTID